MKKKMVFHRDIIDEIVSSQGLYEKIFGQDLLNPLVFNNEFENKKTLLKQVFGFKDIDYVFPKQIERGEFKKLSEIVFRFTPDAYAKPEGIFTKKDNKS